MSRITTAFIAVLAVPSLAFAQRAVPRPEIGIRGGAANITTKSDFGSETQTVVALPSGALLLPGGIHAAFFLSPRVSLEPQLGMFRISDGTDAFTLTSAAIQVNAFVAPDATRAPYLFGQVATLREDESGGGTSMSAFGGGIGYRRVHTESLAMRYELRFRRWNGDGITMNEVALLVGVGAVIR